MAAGVAGRERDVIANKFSKINRNKKNNIQFIKKTGVRPAGGGCQLPGQADTFAGSRQSKISNIEC